MFRDLYSSLDQRTPLHKAAKEGKKETVEYLIKHNTDINPKDIKGVSAYIGE